MELDFLFFSFVGFIVDQRKGDPRLDQPLDESEVDLLRWDAGIDDNHDAGEALASGDVLLDAVVKAVALFFLHTRKAISW